MFYQVIGVFCLVLLGSAFYLMHSLKETKRKQELFYSEIIPHIKEAVIKEDRSSFPALEGFYNNMKIKVVPYVDTLSLRSLPRLYAKIYLAVNNNQLCRVVSTDGQRHLFPSVGFETWCAVVGENPAQFLLFLSGEQKGKGPDYSIIADILAGIPGCSEILFQKNYIKATLLLARGDKGHYAVLRTAKFPVLVLKYEHFSATVQSILRLRGEVGKIEKAG